MSGRHAVKLCDEIVELPGGQTYVCRRATKDRRGKCQQHREPPAVKHRPDLTMPRKLTDPGDAARERSYG